jgi:hypothetical protein
VDKGPITGEDPFDSDSQADGATAAGVDDTDEDRCDAAANEGGCEAATNEGGCEAAANKGGCEVAANESGCEAAGNEGGCEAAADNAHGVDKGPISSEDEEEDESVGHTGVDDDDNEDESIAHTGVDDDDNIDEHESNELAGVTEQIDGELEIDDDHHSEEEMD